MDKNPINQPLFHSPRPYLSWSQISLFERSPEWYAKKYLFAQAEEQTDSMRFGKRFAQALELQQKTGDDALDNMVNVFPSYPQREYQIEAQLEGVEVPLYGVLDAFDPETLRIGEFKTGRLWTQEMVTESGQLKMYALLVWLKFQQLPSEVRLHWAETQFIEGKGIAFTGVVQQFEAKISLEDLLTFSARVRLAWEGIKTLSAQALAQNIGHSFRPQRLHCRATSASVAARHSSRLDGEEFSAPRPQPPPPAPLLASVRPSGENDTELTKPA